MIEMVGEVKPTKAREVSEGEGFRVNRPRRF